MTRRTSGVTSPPVSPSTVISGLWHGASWNFVLWGFYHGMLVAITRTAGRLLRLPDRWPGPLSVVQITGTFVLVMGGWVFFRETNADYLRTFLSIRPGMSSPAEREVGVHLFLLAATWSLPLFVNDVWVLCRERSAAFNRWIESFGDGFVVAGAQAAAVGALATLTLVLRSQVSLDFIYFQF